MTIQHITALTGHSLDRDTASILPATERHFRQLSKLSAGQHTLDIEKTPFTCRVTVSAEGAIFDLLLQDTDSLLFMNVCCFRREDSETLLDMVRSFAAKLPTLKGWNVLTPTSDCWLYSIPIAPFLASPAQLETAGEIEFYIWNALRKSVEKL